MKLMDFNNATDLYFVRLYLFWNKDDIKANTVMPSILFEPVNV